MSEAGQRLGAGGRTVCAAIVALSAACDGGSGGVGGGRPDRSGDAVERSVRDVEWSVVLDVRGSLQDSTLLAVGSIAADSGGVSVVDPMRARVVRFGRDGGVRWAFGARGSGPGEFERPIQVALDARGRTWVLDDRAMRVTVIGADGGDRLVIPLEGLPGLPNGFVPLPGDELVLAVLDLTWPLVRLDRDGTVIDRAALPGEPLSELDVIRSQFALAGGGAGERWVAAFSFLDGFFAFDGLRARGYRGRYVERVPPPDVALRSVREGGRQTRALTLESSVPSALAADVAGDRVHVLFGGETEDRGRIIDVYEHETGRYVESLRLPRRGFDLAVGGGVFYLAYADPFASILGVRANGGATGAQPNREGGRE
ncbi:MAG: hypothetical protein ACRELC_07510 [Gemmatimonadota bacterium]